MENFEEPIPGRSNEETGIDKEEIIYPPKYEKPDPRQNIWLRSITSLALYLLAGYYIFPDYKILILITAVVMIHEMGHFIAMKFFRYNDLGIFFIPLLGAYVSGSKREVSQKQSAIILLAGPLPGIIIGIILMMLDKNGQFHELFGIPISSIALLFIFLNLINLLPIYPLDGGQLLNRVFLEEESIISKIFILLSVVVMVLFAWNIYTTSKSPFTFILLLFPLSMLFRLFGDKKISQVEKQVEAEGIDTDKEYADLPDKDYWKIRNIIIQEHPGFKDVPTAPPYEYYEKEEKILAIVQSLLHRHLIQDVSIAGKIFIFLIWVAALASPWLLNMDMSYFNGFGFNRN